MSTSTDSHVFCKVRLTGVVWTLNKSNRKPQTPRQKENLFRISRRNLVLYTLRDCTLNSRGTTLVQFVRQIDFHNWNVLSVNQNSKSTTTYVPHVDTCYPSVKPVFRVSSSWTTFDVHKFIFYNYICSWEKVRFRTTAQKTTGPTL